MFQGQIVDYRPYFFEALIIGAVFADDKACIQKVSDAFCTIFTIWHIAGGIFTWSVKGENG